MPGLKRLTPPAGLLTGIMAQYERQIFLSKPYPAGGAGPS